jgi:hypothetical protein
VTVNISNANYYAITASAGGYSVPVPGSGSYTVTFSGGPVTTAQRNVIITAGQNSKADYLAAASGLQPATLANISTRALVGTGESVMIGGFIITGTQPKRIVIRAIGPSLSLPDKMLDPVLELHDSTGGVIGFNDNWGQNANSQEIALSGFAPTNPSESALLVTLAPGAYTAIVSGASQTIGTAVVETYDLDPAANSKLANLSTRASVQTGDNVLIGGLIVMGQKSADVIVRAIGPSLAITGAMVDPTLDLRDGNGAPLAFNDNWRSTQQAAISATGLAPTRDAESAILTSLAPGTYTAIVRSANALTGVAVIEVYHLN